jgi:hypothetical protein
MRLAGHAWAPWDTPEWVTEGYDAVDFEDSIKWPARAHVLHPHDDRIALEVRRRSLTFDEFDDVRGLASTLMGGRPAEQAAGTISLSPRMARKAFRRERCRAFLRDDEPEGGRELGDGRLASESLRIGEILGRAPEVADAWADQFALATPSRLGHASADLAANVLAFLQVCLGTSTKRRRPCVDAVGAQWAPTFLGPKDPNAAMLRGAKLYADGDLQGALKAWHPLLLTSSFATYLPADLFDEGGEPETAEKLDENQVALKTNRIVRGFGMPDLRIARRAFKRGDKAKARAIAKQLLAAWTSLDAQIPWTGELRKMAAE